MRLEPRHCFTWNIEGPPERLGRLDAGGHKAALACSCRARISSSVSAAGVTPSIRAACPRVSGRTRASFSRSSVESPGMAR